MLFSFILFNPGVDPQGNTYYPAHGHDSRGEIIHIQIEDKTNRAEHNDQDKGKNG